jgi:hypothetical protein
MRRRPTLALTTALMTLLLVGAQAVPASAAGTSFGAKLDNQSQPSNAEGGQRCDDNAGIGSGATCTWVGTEAYHNGGNFKAPKAGTIRTLRLVTCVSGRFTLQIARAVSGGKYKVVRNGPIIRYKADPFLAAGGVCGGDNGVYKVQKFSISVHVNKGDLIAVKAAKLGTLYCAGGSGVQLFDPPLAAGGAAKTPDTSGSCDLLVSLTYG